MAITSVGTLGQTGTSGSGTSFTHTTTTSALSTSGDIGILEVVSDNISTADGNTNDHTSVTGGNGVWTKLYEQTNTVGGAAGDGVCVSLWAFRSTGANAIGTVFTINHGSTGDRCCSMWKFTVGAGNDLGLALTPHGYTTDAANGFGTNTISGLGSLSRLYLAAYGKEANSTTALTPSTSFTELTGTRSRNNANAVIVRGEFRINTSTGETANPTLAISGDNAMIFVALFEATGLTQTASDDANNLSDALAKAVGIPKSFADDANNLSDAFTKTLGYSKTFSDDANNLSDALTKILGLRLPLSNDVNLLTDYFTYGRRPRWRDAIATALGSGGPTPLTLSLSDSVNNLSDTFTKSLAGPRITFLEAGGASTGGLHLWDSSTGTVTVDTSIKPAGAYSSLKIDATIAAGLVASPVGVLGQANRVSFYRRASADPSVGSDTIFKLRDSGGIEFGRLQINTAGKIQWLDGQDVVVATGSTALPHDTFSRVSFGFNTNGSPDNLSVKAYVNGSLEFSITGINTDGKTSGSWFELGCGGNLSGQVYYAHIYVDDGSDLTDPGAGYAYGPAVAAKASTTVSNNNWDTVLGSGAVNERPLSETNGVESASTNGTYQTYGIQSAATGDVNLTGLPILGRMAWVRAKESSVAGSPAIVDNGSATPITLTTSSATYRHAVADLTYPTDASAVGMISGTAATFLYEAGVVVAFIPPIPVEVSDSINSLADSLALQLGIAVTLTDNANNLADSYAQVEGELELLADTLALNDSATLGHGLGCTDSLTLADTAALSLEHRVTFIDTLNALSDAAVVVLGVNETLADTLAALTDAYQQIEGQLQSFTDSCTLSDAAAINLGLLELANDSIALTDSEQHVVGYNELLADDVNLLADSTALLLAQLLALSDTQPTYIDYATACLYLLGIEIECVDSAAHIGLEFYDSFALSDAFTKQFISNVADLPLEFADSVVLTDSLALGYGLSTSDAVALTDSNDLQLGQSAAFTDALTITDTALLNEGHLLGFNDSFIIIDSESRTLGYNELFTDSIALTDSQSTQLGQLLTFTDPINNLADAYSQLANGLLTFSDTLTFTDSLLLGHGLLISDDINLLVDSITTNAPQGPNVQVGVTDALVLTDSVQVQLGYSIALSDNASLLADLVAETVGLAVIITDNAPTLTDAESALLQHLLRVTDSLALIDALTKFGEGFLGLADSIAITDSAAVELRGPDLSEALADSLTLTDAIALTLSNELQLQLTFTDAITLADHYFDIRYPYPSSAKRHVVVSSAPRVTTVTGKRGIQVPGSNRTSAPAKRSGIIVPPDDRKTKVE